MAPPKLTAMRCRRCKRTLPRDDFEPNPAPGFPGRVYDYCRSCRLTVNQPPSPLIDAGDALLVPLGNGLLATIDHEDGDLVSPHRWRPLYTRHAVYAVATVNGRPLLLHRLIMDDPPGFVIDHADRNTLDCRRHNLRETTQGLNLANAVTPRHNTSGFKGVSTHPRSRRWRATIQVNGKSRHIGTFDTPEDAARAYDAAARESFGEFARTNF